MKDYYDFHWPTWEEMAIERQERWNNLPRKVKVRFVKEWRQFAMQALICDLKISRKIFRQTITWQKLK